ncbi:MAG: helix-turn-helix domain-containing protein [Bacteroidales bacterium]|nr:helix-turn-helix domain-containing protein [Bacteroidales bacterium]
MKQIDDMSNAELVAMLGERYKDYRIRMGKSQKEVAEFSGVSVFTISQFENGSAKNITLDSLFRMLRSIDMIDVVDRLLEPLPPSPVILEKLNKTHRERVYKPRKKNDEE